MFICYIPVPTHVVRLDVHVGLCHVDVHIHVHVHVASTALENIYLHEQCCGSVVTRQVTICEDLGKRHYLIIITT